MSDTKIRKLLLLGLLNRVDMHGYHLNAHLESKIPIQIKKPTAYNLLARMEQDEWIAHKSEFTGKRERRIYSLTPKGREIYRKFLKEELSTFRLQEYPNLVGIWLLEDIPKVERKELLADRMKSLQGHLSMFNNQEEDGEDLHNAHEGNSALVIEFIRRSLELELDILKKMVVDHE